MYTPRLTFIKVVKRPKKEADMNNMFDKMMVTVRTTFIMSPVKCHKSFHAVD